MARIALGSDVRGKAPMQEQQGMVIVSGGTRRSVKRV